MSSRAKEATGGFKCESHSIKEEEIGPKIKLGIEWAVDKNLEPSGSV